MTRTSPPQVAFSSGELDPLLHRRFDYQRFQTGLRTCKGFLPLAQGGFTRAPGTLFRGNTKGNAAAVLIPFQFAADDALVLEFTPGVMRVWRYGQLVMFSSTPYELAHPYDAAALANLKWVQSADVIYLVDGTLPVQRLERLALNDWNIAPAVYNKGPFRVQNLDKSTTLQASAMTGAVTLTASNAFFVEAQVGSLMLLEPSDNTTVPLWTSNEVTAIGARRRYGENVYELTLYSGPNVGTNPPIHTEGEALSDNTTKWKFLSDSKGIVRITARTDATHATATVLKAIPQACVDSPTYRWSEGAWSERYGYPSTVELYEQRAVFAATRSEPRSVWFSTIGNFRDFTPGVEADSAFAYTISGDGSINRIINLKRGRTGLHVFALGEEHSTRSDSSDQAIGPTTINFGFDGAVGSSPARPIAPHGNPIFISRDKRRVMMVAYELQQDSKNVQILSRIAQHLGADGYEQIVWQGAPEPIAWLRQTNGQLVAMIHDPSEDVLGWARVPVAGGRVESLAVSSNADGSADILTMVVRRVVNGQVRRFIEEQAVIFGLLTGEDSLFDACHLFAARQIVHEEPSPDIAMPHLVGQEVYAWTDQGEFGPIIVPQGGTVTLPVPCGQVTVGMFDATHLVETLDITAASNDGSSMGRPKRLYSGFGLALHRTAQGKISVVERDFAVPAREGQQMNIVPRQVAGPMVDAFSGVASIAAPSGHARELWLRIRPYHGAPLTVTGIIPTVQEAGR